MKYRILRRLKPGVPRQIHLLLTAILWSLIGSILIFRGLSWLLDVARLWIAAPALMIGTIKSLLILDKAAKKGIHRILKMADGTCLGAVYSLKTWLLVLCMIGAGMVLRHSSLPGELLGGLYVAIGWSLFFSSRHAWRQITEQWDQQ